jgi:hypothetical protein
MALERTTVYRFLCLVSQASDAVGTLLALAHSHVDRRAWLWYQVGVGRKRALLEQLQSFGFESVHLITDDGHTHHHLTPVLIDLLLVVASGGGDAWLRPVPMYADVLSSGASYALMLV